MGNKADSGKVKSALSSATTVLQVVGHVVSPKNANSSLIAVKGLEEKIKAEARRHEFEQ